MKFKKLTALLLCAALFLTALTACTKPVVPDGESAPVETEPSAEIEPSAEAEPSDGAEVKTGIDYDTAYEAYPPDTVIMTIGDTEIKWEEYFFFLCNNISYLESLNSDDFDMSSDMGDGETLSSLALGYSTQNALSYRGLVYGADLMGITITDEEKAGMEADYDTASANMGGEEILLGQIRKNSHIYSKDLFLYLYGLEYLTSLCYLEMFGENCEKVPDEKTQELADADGYMTVKHILRKTPADSTDTEGKERAYNEAQDILNRLNSYDGDDFDAYFDELMHSESDDSGALASFPDGYLFQDGDMVPEFYEACTELEIGGLSGIIETTHGYHIIYRLPVNYDLTPISYVNEGYTTTLRQLCATDIFNSSLYGWMENLEPVYSDIYNNLDLPAIFKEYA